MYEREKGNWRRKYMKVSKRLLQRCWCTLWYIWVVWTTIDGFEQRTIKFFPLFSRFFELQQQQLFDVWLQSRERKIDLFTTPYILLYQKYYSDPHRSKLWTVFISITITISEKNIPITKKTGKLIRGFYSNIFPKIGVMM